MEKYRDKDRCKDRERLRLDTDVARVGQLRERRQFIIINSGKANK